jgi:hypothetical protein
MAAIRTRATQVIAVSVTVIAALAASGTTTATAPDAPAVEILPPDESYAGATRGEWDALNWQWALSMPRDVSPNVNPTNERCGWGQSGPVFFLPGNFDGLPMDVTCVVAEGTAIYVTWGAECSTVEPPPFFGRTEEELRDCAIAWVDQAEEVTAEVNGQEVPDLESYRTTSPLFTLTLPEDNVFGVEPGVAEAVSDAYSFIIAPPPPGEYEITVTFTFVGDSQTYGSTVTVIVEEAQVIEPPPTTDAPATTDAGPAVGGPGTTEEPVTATTEV